MKLMTELNALLGELQTWEDSKNSDHQVAALKNFARRAKELLVGPEGTILVEYPKEDRALRKLLCQALNQVLEARGVRYQTTGRHFIVMPDLPKTIGKDAVCKICDGGPGNHGVCLCGGEAYENPAPPAPGLPLVPLGPNRTKSGRRVEVLRNDLDSGFPIVAKIYREDDTYFLAEYKADGLPHGGLDECMRLTGHLPPEPVKPREIWYTPNGTTLEAKPGFTPPAGSIRFREVTPAAGKQYHAWVNDDGGIRTPGGFLNETAAANLGYRKAILMEVVPS